MHTLIKLVFIIAVYMLNMKKLADFAINVTEAVEKVHE